MRAIFESETDVFNSITVDKLVLYKLPNAFHFQPKDTSWQKYWLERSNESELPSEYVVTHVVDPSSRIIFLYPILKSDNDIITGHETEYLIVASRELLIEFKPEDSIYMGSEMNIEQGLENSLSLIPQFFGDTDSIVNMGSDSFSSESSANYGPLNFLSSTEKPVDSLDPEIAKILNEDYKPSGYHAGHGYVDLGLSVKWATCNVGASHPFEIGGFYAWGETETKDRYNVSNYKYAIGKQRKFMFRTEMRYNLVKYNDKCQHIADEDDVAMVKWGNGWRMPSYSECKELQEFCEVNWDRVKGVFGIRIISNVNGFVGNSIFLPVTDQDQKRCKYWMNTKSYNVNACYFEMYRNAGHNYFDNSYASMVCGLPVRPVLP